MNSFSLSTYLRFRTSDRSPELRAHLSRWAIDTSDIGAQCIISFGIFAILVAIFLFPPVQGLGRDLHVFSLAFSFTSLAGCAIARYGFGRNVNRVIRILSVFIFIFASIACHFEAPQLDQSRIHFNLVANYLLAFGTVCACPVYWGKLDWLWYSITYCGINTIAIFAGTDDVNMRTLAVIAPILFPVLKGLVVNLFLYFGLFQFYAQQVGVEREKAKQEHELALAARIQQSLLPGKRTVSYRDFQIDMYHKSHASVGGDWASYWEVDDNQMVVVTMDATGKGIQAALVVHAVQALWADAKTHETFDAAKWIARVNNALLTMGTREAHTMTLAILEIKGDQMTYWSAAHPPLLVEDDERNHRFIYGRGNLLGLSPDAQLTPVSLNATKQAVLYSDGLIPNASTFGKRQRGLFFAGLEEHGLKHVDAIDEQDDKTMIWIQRRSTTSTHQQTGS